MALTIAYDAASPGKAALRPALVQTARVMKFVTGKIDFDASYPTGGESIAEIADYFAAGGFLGIVFEMKGGYVFTADYTADAEKVLAYWGDNNNASDGPLIEVANATNLASVTGVRFMAWGY